MPAVLSPSPQEYYITGDMDCQAIPGRNGASRYGIRRFGPERNPPRLRGGMQRAASRWKSAGRVCTTGRSLQPRVTSAMPVVAAAASQSPTSRMLRPSPANGRQQTPARPQQRPAKPYAANLGRKIRGRNAGRGPWARPARGSGGGRRRRRASRNWETLQPRNFYHRELALIIPADCAHCAVPVPPATASRLSSDSAAFGSGGSTK